MRNLILKRNLRVLTLSLLVIFSIDAVAFEKKVNITNASTRKITVQGVSLYGDKASVTPNKKDPEPVGGVITVTITASLPPSNTYNIGQIMVTGSYPYGISCTYDISYTNDPPVPEKITIYSKSQTKPCGRVSDNIIISDP